MDNEEHVCYWKDSTYCKRNADISSSYSCIGALLVQIHCVMKDQGINRELYTCTHEGRMNITEIEVQ